MAVEYRGQGKQQGKPSAISIKNDATQVQDFLKNEFHAEQIHLLGFSIGSGPATFLLQQQIDSIILVSPFTSIDSILLEQTNFHVRSDSFDNLSAIRQANSARIMVVHGLNDNILCQSNTLNLFRMSNYDKINILLLSNKTHNNLMTYLIYQIIQDHIQMIKEFTINRRDVFEVLQQILTLDNIKCILVQSSQQLRVIKFLSNNKFQQIINSKDNIQLETTYSQELQQSVYMRENATIMDVIQCVAMLLHLNTRIRKFLFDMKDCKVDILEYKTKFNEINF